MRTPDARTTFIDFFAARGHAPVASSPVIPHGDPTILFANAGMNQFKDVFVGREKRPYVRAVTAQKCIRAGGKHNDLDNVGKTARHLTFFEMLGNFSFGDYFKEDAIAWAWELLTVSYGLPPDRLYATVYEEDDEARRIWRKAIGLPADRIVGCGKKDNFWSMGDVGPCGPCSEILFDRGEAHGCGPKCGIGTCDCDRYFEVWNLVFMQFYQAPDGTVSKLPRPSIDTGMGLERLCMVLDGVDSVYETDVLGALVDAVVRLSGKPYDRGRAGVPHRVVADHVRSLCFALADGAYPANEGRGYVVRRILRRAARYGRKLDLGKPFLHTLVPLVVELMGDAYPELSERRDRVAELVLAEEEQFGRTLDQGLARFEDIRRELVVGGRSHVSGKDLFLLHDTFGFPPDLVARMAEEENLTVDLEGYEAEMAKQKARSRARAGFDDALAGGLDLSAAPPTGFRGYETTRMLAQVIAVSSLPEGRTAVVLGETPFYGESGGQVGDRGVLEGDGVRLVVEETQRRGEHTLHVGRVEGAAERLAPGATVTAAVAAGARARTQRNHTATHLLHAALRAELGTHVEQRGSLVAPDRLRFDFTHFAPVSREDLRKIERRVNEAVVANLPVSTAYVPLADARSKGAMALFGEKYGETVRMVTMEGVSCELCGGTHVARTGDIGTVKVLSEGSVAAGIRRIEAVTGPEALERWYEAEDILSQCAEALRTSPPTLVRRVQSLQEEVRQLRQKKTPQEGAPAEQGTEKVGPVTVDWRILGGADQGDLRGQWDRLRDKLAQTVLVLVGLTEHQVALLVCATPDLRGARGLHCGNLARAGGAAMAAGGGGRPEMGQAGGKEPGKVREALAAVIAELRAQVGAT